MHQPTPSTRLSQGPTRPATPRPLPTQPTRWRVTEYLVPGRAPPHRTLRRLYGARGDEEGTATRNRRLPVRASLSDPPTRQARPRGLSRSPASSRPWDR